MKNPILLTAILGSLISGASQAHKFECPEPKPKNVRCTSAGIERTSWNCKMVVNNKTWKGQIVAPQPKLTNASSMKLLGKVGKGCNYRFKFRDGSEWDEVFLAPGN